MPPFASRAQERLMQMVAHGKPATRLPGGGPTKAVAQEFIAKSAGKHKPARMMGGAPKPQRALLQTADRTLSTANDRLSGMPGLMRRQGMQGKVMMAKGGLSKMHFQRAAEIMKRHGEAGRAAGAKDPVSRKVAEDLADWFQESNERFDRKRFMNAAGFGDEPVKKAKGGRVSMRDFIQANKTEIDEAIRRSMNRGREKNPIEATINNEERRQWLLNDEGLYNWARSSGVKLAKGGRALDAARDAAESVGAYAKGGLSRKHFRAVAEAFRKEGDAPGYRERNESMAQKMADYFASENPRFDRKRFMDAAGYDDAYFTAKGKRAKGP